MEQRLFVLLLFTGVIPLILSIRRKYHLIQQGKTWNDAQAYCRATYVDLATIETNDNMVQIQNEIQTQKFSSSAWIGLYTNINSWHWSFGNEPLGSFTSWVSPEPDDKCGNEQCVMNQQGGWHDAPCAWSNFFVCFDDTKTGTDSFILVSVKMSWYDAQSYCRLHYTDLASIKNTAENSLIGGLSMDFIWFGLGRDPWKWSDQTLDVSMITWLPADNNDYLQNKSCGYFLNNKANVARCSDKIPFYCYEFTKQQQIIRVKVNSSQDVNDPTIMATFMEKIQQKQGGHGTGNITVKLREQPDRVVFHKDKQT
ncbi:macrophage mannose receptor 1-like [Clarias gariepinus]|uniref:macrophage mannose receptor 1-like n=1 Tax=Clarias gariepinus TaxID=13013 RepID=UPI00234DD603|nr:macrophage mannose receptor 1-like [Clarias gariepinus]